MTGSARYVNDSCHQIAGTVVAMVAMLGMSRRGGGVFPPVPRQAASAYQAATAQLAASEGKDGTGSVPRAAKAAKVG